MPRNNNIQFRRGTNTQWSSANPILASGEPGFVTDFNILKIGDGTKQWDDLSAINEALATIVRNNTASTIPKMSVVYINGAQGDTPTIQLAIASGELTSSKTYGITTGDITAGGIGSVVAEGALKHLSTSPTFDGVTPGTVLYLSPSTSGGITTTKPSAPNHIVALGNLIRVHNQQGIINVKIQNGFELGELHNVAINGTSNGQFLQYNSASGLWVASSSGNFTTLNVNNNPVWHSGNFDTSNIARTTGNQTFSGYNTFSNGVTFLTYTSYGDIGTYGDDMHYLDLYGPQTLLGSNISVFLPIEAGTLALDHRNMIAGSGLTGGGTIAADRTFNIGVGDGITVGSDAISVDGTVIRTTGNQNISGNLIIGGNLTVNGSTVTTNVDTMTIKDPILTLGLASGNIAISDTLDRGIALVRATGLTAFMGWDSSSNQFVMLSSGVATNNSGNYDAGTYGNLGINDLNSSRIYSSRIDLSDGINDRFISAGAEGDTRFIIASSGGLGLGSAIASIENASFYVSSNGYVQNGIWNASTIPVNKGGTGRTSYSNGQLLIGSGTSLVANTLTPTNGIGITNDPGTITIGVTGIPSASITDFNSSVSGLLTPYQLSITNPVTGTGVANHIPYWSSSSGLLADSNELVWDSTNDKLGIGTSSPSEKLDVVGNIKVGDLVLGYNASFDQYGLTNTNGGSAPLYIISDLAAMNLFSSIGITIDADVGNVVLQPSNGNVGIGNSSPTTKLDVTGDVNIDGNLTFDSYTESVVSNGNSGTSKTLDLTTGTVHTCTLTGNCTFTMPTATAGKSFTMFLNTGSGNYTASFSGVRWSDSTAPTITSTAGKVDILSFISDGSYWYGSFSQNYG